MYEIEIETLLYILGGRSGLLTANIHSLPGCKGRCQATIQLLRGKITACTVVDSRGQMISGQPAFGLLQQKVFTWTYTEQAIPSQPIPPLSDFSGQSSSAGPSPQYEQAKQNYSPYATDRAGSQQPFPDEQLGGAAPSPNKPGPSLPARPRQTFPGERSGGPSQADKPGSSPRPSQPLNPERPLPPLPLPFQEMIKAVPKRAIQPTAQFVQSWTHAQRSIFRLVDGKRSLETIAQILNQDLEKVLPVVVDMLKIGWLTL
ncbi:hypothetical protein [Tengunoibacter tsumagoiensis]|nr:hypothetical protein [Tengunoibacter tsumagoiensis]